MTRACRHSKTHLDTHTHTHCGLSLAAPLPQGFVCLVVCQLYQPTNTP